MEDLNNIINKLDLFNIYGKYCVIAAEYIFFSNAHVIFTKTDHTLDHKSQ